MKQSSIKRILIPIMLVLTLTAMLVCVSAAETTETVQNPTAKLTVTSVKTGETVETLYADANEAALAIYGRTYDAQTSVLLEFLKPIKDFPYISDIHCSCDQMVIDLGGFTHEIKMLTFSGTGTFTIRNGTFIGTGDLSHYIYDNQGTGILQITDPNANVILAKDASVRCQDISMVAERESGDAVFLKAYSNDTVLLKAGTLINYGQIVGGSSEATAVVVNSGASLYNHGTIAGGNADIAKHYKYGGYAVRGNVVLNTGVIRGGDITGIGPEYVSAQGGWGVYGDVEENRGQILGGSANVTIANGYATPGFGVCGSVGRNSGEILGGTAANSAENGTLSPSKAVSGTVSENTGTIFPVAFAQTDLTVYIDGEALTSETPYPYYDGKEHTITYTLTFGGKEAAFEGVTSSLTLDGITVDTLHEAGKYTFTVTCGEETKTAPIAIRPATPFTDITEDHPYYADIAGVYQKGLMNGTEPNVFSPDTTLSRAMLVTMLWRMEGQPVVNYAMQFSDVAEEDWYAEAIRWAAAEGLVLGYDDGTFGVNNPITLEQMAVILYRYEQYKGGGFTGMWMFRLNYDDIADISEWAYEAVCYMVMKGVYCAPTETTLQPQKSATRAEAAGFLNRYADYRASLISEVQ